MSLTNIALNSRSMNGQIVLSDGVAVISEGNIDCEDINSANLNTDNINTNLLNVTGKLECNSAGPYNIPISISSVTGLLIGYGHTTNSGATDFLNFGSTYTSTQQGFRFWNKSSTQTLTNLAIIDNTQTYFKSQLVGCLAESPVNPTSVVNRSYVDDNFLDRTNNLTQNINGLKTFTNTTTFSSGLKTDSILVNNNNINFGICLASTNTSIRLGNASNSLTIETSKITLKPSSNTYSTDIEQSGINFFIKNNNLNGTLDFRVSTNAVVLLLDATNTTISNNLISNSQATFNNICPISNTNATLTNHLTTLGFNNGNYVDFTTNQIITGSKTFSGINSFKDIRFTDSLGSSNIIQAYLSGPNFGFVSVNVNNTLYYFQTKDGIGTITNPLIIDSASTTISNNLVSNNITAPSTTGTNNIYTNLIGGGTINIGTLLSSNVVAGNTTFSSDISTSNIFCNDALYLNDYQSPTTYSSILVQNTDILNFDANFNNNKFQFKVSSNAVLLLDATDTTIYNNLNSLSQASFSNFTPICNVASPTANNHLVRKDFVDNNFMSLTLSQTKSGTVNFLNRITFNGGSGGGTAIDCNNGLNANTTLYVAGQSTFNNTALLYNGSRYYNTTNYTEFLQTGTQLTIKPVSNSGSLALFSTNLSGVQTQQLLINNSGATTTTLNSTNIFSSNYGTSTANGTTAFSFGTTTGIISIGSNITSGSINLGTETGYVNVYGTMQFFGNLLINFSTIQQIGTTLNIENPNPNATIKLKTRPSVGAVQDSLTINTTSCDISSPTLNLTSSSSTSIQTPNNTTGYINLFTSATSAIINFCSSTFLTSVLYLNARLAHKAVQYMNEVKTLSGTSHILVFPLEQRWMFTSTGATQIVVDLPELTASHQAGFYFTLFKTASNTNSVKINRQGTNVIRSYNSITDLTTATILSGTGSSLSIITAEISTGVFAWIVTA
ncbi:MAG: hypothetical protein RLZZ354_585 [Pseudomonadota bacterium]|jgi:hypothetical protein